MRATPQLMQQLPRHAFARARSVQPWQRDRGLHTRSRDPKRGAVPRAALRSLAACAAVKICLRLGPLAHLVHVDWIGLATRNLDCRFSVRTFKNANRLTLKHAISVRRALGRGQGSGVGLDQFRGSVVDEVHDVDPLLLPEWAFVPPTTEYYAVTSDVSTTILQDCQVRSNDLAKPPGAALCDRSA